MSDDLDRDARAAGRATWPVRAYRLGQEPVDDLRTTTSAAERVAMVWQITQDAWSLAGRTIPEYLRHQTPVRVVRLAAGAQPDSEESGSES